MSGQDALEPTRIYLDELRERIGPLVERLRVERGAAPSLVETLQALADLLPVPEDTMDLLRLCDLLGAVRREVIALQNAGPARTLRDDAVIQVTAFALLGHHLVTHLNLPARPAPPPVS